VSDQATAAVGIGGSLIAGLALVFTVPLPGVSPTTRPLFERGSSRLRATRASVSAAMESQSNTNADEPETDGAPRSPDSAPREIGELEVPPVRPQQAGFEVNPTALSLSDWESDATGFIRSLKDQPLIRRLARADRRG
jgi:hypothetical protein